MFAAIAGIGLSLAILWQGVSAISWQERRNQFVFLLLVMGLSGFFGLAENGMINIDKGIIQRLLYISGLAWLIYQENILLKNANK